MFNSITWTDFLLAIAGLSAAYYFTAGLLFYHQELIARFKGIRKISAPPPTPQSPDDNADDLLGPIKRTPSVNIPEPLEADDPVQFSNPVIADAQIFASDLHTAEPGMDNRVVLGRISDLLEEVKIILSLFADEKPSKEDLASTLRALLEKYESLASSRYLSTINIFLYDLCKDVCAEPLRPEDVDAWWPAHSIK